MNISLSVRAISMAIVGVCAAACSDSPTQSTADDVSVTVAVSRPQFRSGDSTTITTTIVNNGETSVLMPEQPSCVALFEVVSGSNIVAPGQPICALLSAGAAIRLAPGETRQFAQVWRGENRTLQIQLGTGAYGVRGNVMTSVGTIVSSSVAIQILP